VDVINEDIDGGGSRKQARTENRDESEIELDRGDLDVHRHFHWQLKG
jgi:hypothetical protein